MRGTKAFIETFNLNNSEHPITNISIGTNRNTILDHLTNDEHPVVGIQQALRYSDYSLSSSGYNGDWEKGQRLVLKK